MEKNKSKILARKHEQNLYDANFQDQPTECCLCNTIFLFFTFSIAGNFQLKISNQIKCSRSNAFPLHVRQAHSGKTLNNHYQLSPVLSILHWKSNQCWAGTFQVANTHKNRLARSRTILKFDWIFRLLARISWRTISRPKQYREGKSYKQNPQKWHEPDRKQCKQRAHENK